MTATPRVRLPSTARRLTHGRLQGTRRLELEREETGSALHRDPPELRELRDRRAAAEASPPTVLDAAERHVRLVVDRLVVDVDDSAVRSPTRGHAARRVRGPRYWH